MLFLMIDFVIIGIAIFVGLLSGKLFEEVGIPEVVGIVLVGVILGESGLGFLTIEKLDYFKPLIDLTLAFFGFFIGAELKFNKLRKLSWVIISILISEVVITFIMVTSFLFLYTNDLYLSLLLASLAVSTAPAATADVIWEYQASGELATTILALIGFDDVAAVLIYSITTTHVFNLISENNLPLFSYVGYFLHYVGLAILLGVVLGITILLSAKIIREREEVFVIAIAIVIMASGVADLFNVSDILTSLIIGMVFSNYCKVPDPTINTLKKLSAPLFAIFFVLMGARLNILLIPLIGIIGILFLGSSMIGKTLGATLGAYISRANANIKKNIGFSLYSQAGIALGLAIKLHFDLKIVGGIGIVYANYILNTIVTTALLLLVIGPIFLKFALKRAGEIKKIKKEEPCR